MKVTPRNWHRIDADGVRDMLKDELAAAVVRIVDDERPGISIRYDRSKPLGNRITVDTWLFMPQELSAKVYL